TRSPAAIRRSGSRDGAWRRRPAGLLRRSEEALGLQPLHRLLVLQRQAVDDLRRRQDVVDVAHALAGAPDVPPDLGTAAAAGAEGHLALVGRGQVVGVQPGLDDALAQVVAVNAGEQVGVDD